jgi:hypothetical protein
MLHNFTLYNILYNEASEEEMTLEEKTNVVKLIKKIDIEGCELIYAIIRCYQLENENHLSSTLPYDGKVVKTGMKWDAEKIPTKLFRMIETFLKKHILKMNEEKVLRQTRKNSKKNGEHNTIVDH